MFLANFLTILLDFNYLFRNELEFAKRKAELENSNHEKPQENLIHGYYLRYLYLLTLLSYMRGIRYLKAKIYNYSGP